MRTTLSLLNEIGYDTHYKILSASNYGIPQKRERLYIVCFRKDLKVGSFNFPLSEKTDVALEDILLPGQDSSIDDLVIERVDVVWKENLISGRENAPIRIGTLGKGGQGERIYSTKGHAVTLSAYGGGVGAKTGIYLIEGKVRRLHPRECARLMGFPENFQLHKRRNVCYKQFGNSVAIPVVKKIFNQIQKSLHSSEKKAA